MMTPDVFQASIYLKVCHGSLNPVFNCINHVLTPKRVNPIWKMSWIIHSPKETVTSARKKIVICFFYNLALKKLPNTPIMICQPIQHVVYTKVLEVIIFRFIEPPLHSILSNGIIEVVPGKRTVWIIRACHPAIRNLIVCQGSTYKICLLYTSPSPRDRQKPRMPSSA